MKGDKTTVLALIAAAVILAVVGIKSFLDYKVAELEKIHGSGQAQQSAEPSEGAASPTEGESQSEQAVTDPATGLPPSGDIAQVSATENASGEFPAGSIDRLPRSVLPPIPTELQTPPDAPAPPASDPRSQAELDALRRENAMFQEKLNQIRSGGNRVSADGTPPIPPPPTPGSDGPLPITNDGPSSALSAVMDGIGNPGAGPDGGIENPGSPPLAPGSFGPMGEQNDGEGLGGISTGASSADVPPLAPGGAGAPDAAGGPVQSEAEIAAMAEQVKRQPALAKVIDFDPEWAILVISGGAESNISPEMRLAVRRGDQIVGFIKVTEVEQNQSVAELMSRNKFSPTARKPQPGDDVIAFNLF